MRTTTNLKRDSRVLGIVAIGALAACVLGARLTEAQPAQVAVGINGHPTNSTTITNVVNTTAIPSNTAPSATAVPVDTVAAPAVTVTTPAGMTAYVDSALPYSLDYPSDWTKSTSTASGVTYFTAVAPDQNAEVVVGAEASPSLNTAGLQSQLETNVNALVTSAGFTATAAPQYTSGSVNGVPTQAAQITIRSSNGATGTAAAAVVYYKGELYFVVGVINDDSTSSATQETAQLQSVASSFALR